MPPHKKIWMTDFALTLAVGFDCCEAAESTSLPTQSAAKTPAAPQTPRRSVSRLESRAGLLEFALVFMSVVSSRDQCR
jgi:hypothetical protein